MKVMLERAANPSLKLLSSSSFINTSQVFARSLAINMSHRSVCDDTYGGEFMCEDASINELMTVSQTEKEEVEDDDARRRGRRGQRPPYLLEKVEE